MQLRELGRRYRSLSEEYKKKNDELESQKTELETQLEEAKRTLPESTDQQAAVNESQEQIDQLKSVSVLVHFYLSIFTCLFVHIHMLILYVSIV